MSKVMVDAQLLLDLIRCYKLFNPVETNGVTERKNWIECHRLECVAQGKVTKSRAAKSPD